MQMVMILDVTVHSYRHRVVNRQGGGVNEADSGRSQEIAAGFAQPIRIGAIR